MKHVFIIIGTSAILALVGCSSTPVAVAPVGPNPAGLNLHTKDGQLQVFSALTGRIEGDNPTWFQHTDYTIYDEQGNFVMHVANESGYYARPPRLVVLHPGKYIVKAEAKDYWDVKVPVVIKPGRVTRVHLDDAWKPAYASKSEVVNLPEGAPVGWSKNAY